MPDRTANALIPGTWNPTENLQLPGFQLKVDLQMQMGKFSLLNYLFFFFFFLETHILIRK